MTTMLGTRHYALDQIRSSDLISMQLDDYSDTHWLYLFYDTTKMVKKMSWLPSSAEGLIVVTGDELMSMERKCS
jgi:hypothetical protein